MREISQFDMLTSSFPKNNLYTEVDPVFSLAVDFLRKPALPVDDGGALFVRILHLAQRRIWMEG